MRHAKRACVCFGVVVALTAAAAASASAAAPEFSPGAAGTKLTGTSKAGTLEMAGGEMVCTADSVAGELTGATKKRGTATVTFTGCSTFGILGAHSLGDPEGKIKVEVGLELCYIKKAKPVEVGVLTEIIGKEGELNAKKENEKGVHVEVFGKLIVITGDQAGVITPINTLAKNYTISYKTKGIKGEPAGCEGKTETLLSRENEKGEFAGVGEETSEEDLFSVAQTLVA